MTTNQDATANPLDLIEARANAATNGPWRTATDAIGDAVWYSVIAKQGAEFDTLVSMDGASQQNHADAVFIAAARTDVPKLVAALRAVEELCTTSEDHAEPYGDTPTIYVETVRDMIREALDG